MNSFKIIQSITIRDSAMLDKYLKSLDKIQIMTPEEEFETAVKSLGGCPKAREQLVVRNLKFVVSVAKQYTGKASGMSLLDLINEGAMGMMTAAARFDPHRGFKFISFAVWWVRQAILEAIGTNSKQIRIPSNRRMQIRKIMKAEESLRHSLGREPSLKELSKKLGMSRSYIQELQQNGQPIMSIEAQYQDTDMTLLDTIPTTSDYSASANIMRQDRYQHIERELNSLLKNRSISQLEFSVITLCFGITEDRPLTLEEVSKRVKRSRERVRQIRGEMLRKLRILLDPMEIF